MMKPPTRHLLAVLLLAACARLADGDALAEDSWITDKNGCKIANPSPHANESVIWDGPCVDGYADGEGIMQWLVDGAQGPRYEGSVHQGVISGRGKLSLPDGASYDGEWVDGKQQGIGTLTTPDGATYRGSWKSGEPDGRGVMHTAKGETIRGIWREGTYVGSGGENGDSGEDDGGKKQ